MRIALLHFLKSDKKKHAEILQKMIKTIESKGHQVTAISGLNQTEELRLPIYEYIAVVVPSSPFFSSDVPDQLPRILANNGTLTGKKSCSLVIKSGFASEKMSRNVMRVMEKEGMFVDYFDIIDNADHAVYIWKKIS